MGFFKADSFDNSFDWAVNVPTGGFVEITENTFEDMQENEDKTSTLQLSFNKSYKFQNFTMSKKYYSPIYFKFKDFYNKDILYDTLRITYSVCNSTYSELKSPEDFKFSLGIKYRGDIICEWFFPISSTCEYTHCDFDLKPLFKNHQLFDEFFITVLSDPGHLILKLGSMYLLQESEEIHNIKLAVSDLLHLKYNNYLTNLSENVKSGESSITISGVSDIYKGTTIVFSDDTIKEVHVVKNIDFISENVATITFMDEFDSDKMLYSWPAGTEIYSSVPSSIVQMRDSESVFPLFFVYAEAFSSDESAMSYGNIYDSYIRGTECSVGVRSAWDAVVLNLTINVFASVPEVALEMWRFLKSKITSRETLNVAGKNFQYVISGERDISPDDGEGLPNYVMDLTFYFRHNLYNRKYVRFPRYSKMAVTYEIKAVEAI